MVMNTADPCYPLYLHTVGVHWYGGAWGLTGGEHESVLLCLKNYVTDLLGEALTRGRRRLLILTVRSGMHIASHIHITVYISYRNGFWEKDKYREGESYRCV